MAKLPRKEWKMKQSSQPFGLRLSEGLGCNAQAVTRERAVLFSAPMVRVIELSRCGYRGDARRPLNAATDRSTASAAASAAPGCVTT